MSFACPAITIKFFDLYVKIETGHLLIFYNYEIERGDVTGFLLTKQNENTIIIISMLVYYYEFI